LKALGESLNAFARTLSNPDAHVFLVNENDSITVGEHTNAPPRRPVARVTPDQIDWKDLCQTVYGYGKAKKTDSEASPNSRVWEFQSPKSKRKGIQ